MRVAACSCLISLACSGPPPARAPIPGDTAPLDTGTPLLQAAGTWTPGEVIRCDAPTALGWTDVSDTLEPGPTPMGRYENGGLSVLPGDDGWWITASMGLRAIKTWAPDGTVQVWDRNVATAQLALLDLARDGRPDLIPLAGDLTVQPDWTGAPAEGLTLAELDEEVRYRDASLIDLDGDGQDELLLSLWDGSWGGLEVWRGAGAEWSLSHRVGEGDGGVGQAFDHLIADLTADHVPDVYACNDHGPDFGANRLLVNGGNGTLVDDTPMGAGLAMACMSVSGGDVDADGVLDLWLSGSLRTALLLARDDGYVDVSSVWGAPTLAEESMGWGTAVSDLDNDGLPDLVMARSGFSSTEDGSSRAEVLRQETPGVLVSDPWGIAPAGGSRNVAVLDRNGDGVLDLVWGMLDGAPRIHDSNGCTENAWLQVVAPEGSTVRVMAGDRTWAALVTGQPGFSTTVPVHAHIGLGDTAVVDKVVLDVPWRGRAVLEGPIDARQVLRWMPDG